MDPETIRQLRDAAGEDGFVQIRAEFLSGGARALEEMARAAEGGDADMLRKRIHALKGSSGSLGASRLEALCREIEPTVAGAAAPERAAAVARLAAEFEAVRRALEAA